MQKAEALMGALPEHGETGRRFLTGARAYRLQYWLAKGKSDAAARWLARHGIAVDPAISPGSEIFNLLLARILIAQYEVVMAGSMLQRLTEGGTRDRSLRLAVELAVLQA